MIRATCLLLALSSTAAHAEMDDMAVFQVANELGTVIASEEFCGLAFDQQAIAAYVSATIPADQLDFAPTLQMMISGARFTLSSMSASAKTAHCTAISQTAKHFKFIP